ncbi:MAG TPA: Do family serine endopeptidase [Bryobacteraceae bacterium]|jgi:Do/DeqQ family serine protease|nr:Do family serine endopeptidase [Bryobacteraceae bacterium]
MSNVVQFRRTTAILALVAASIGGGLIAAFAVASRTGTPARETVIARADTSNEKVSQLSNSFADIIEKASPAVVTISSTRVIKASEQQQNNPFTADPFFRQFFGGPNMRPRDQRESGLGSGVIVSPGGYILTNNHVVDKATKLTVGLSDGRDFTAKVVGTDPQTDLAVVKINANDLPTLPFANSDAARVGDLCFAIGNPFHQDHTVTMGIVSAKGRHLEGQTHIQNFIQTDAAINPGNSGGALINAQGRLIGINTMILTGGGGGGMFGGGEGGNIGIGFAVPSNLAKQVMDQIEKNGKVSRGYLGALLGPVTPEMVPQFGLKDAKGALVDQVTPNTPAEKAGLKMGDVIVAIDGKPVNSMDDATMTIISKSPGTTVKLDVIHDGKPKTIDVTLGQRPNGIDWDQKNNQSDNNGDDSDNDNGGNGVTARGITVQALTPDIAQQVGVPPSTKGVVVTDIDQSSPAADAQFLGRGVVIIAVNRQPVSSVSDFKRLMNEAKGKSVLLTVNAGGQTGFTVVQAQ